MEFFFSYQLCFLPFQHLIPSQQSGLRRLCYVLVWPDDGSMWKGSVGVSPSSWLAFSVGRRHIEKHWGCLPLKALCDPLQGIILWNHWPFYTGPPPTMKWWEKQSHGCHRPGHSKGTPWKHLHVTGEKMKLG